MAKRIQKATASSVIATLQLNEDANSQKVSETGFSIAKILGPLAAPVLVPPNTPVLIANSDTVIHWVYFGQQGVTTIGVLSNGVAVPVAAGTIHVASTTGFPSAGFLQVPSTTGIQSVTYTGKSPTTFTGVAGGDGVGTMSTGGMVSVFAVAPSGFATGVMLAPSSLTWFASGTDTYVVADDPTVGGYTATEQILQDAPPQAAVFTTTVNTPQS